MKFSLKMIAGPLLVVLGLCGSIYLWHVVHPTPSLQSAVPEHIADFDGFQNALAKRVLGKLGAGSTGGDLSAVVAVTAYPVGTLLRATESVPANFEDCVPATLPKSYAAGHLFPSYTMSTDTALTANLGSNAIQGLDSAGVKFKQASSIRYTIENAEIQIMDDKSVEQVTSQGGCGRYIATHPGTRLIRGAVTGKMTFTVNVDNPASAKAQLVRIGGFSVDDDPNSSTLSISDNQSQPIVELLSEFRPLAEGSSSHPSPSALRPAIAPSPVGAAGKVTEAIGANPRIFVQQDLRDAPETGSTVIKILKASWPNAVVVPVVERVPTEKMPPTPQVRFFNASDAGLAAKCLEILKHSYPNARIVRIGLPSPQGQLEVWLQKTGTPPHV